MRNDPATPRSSFPPKPNQSVTSAEGSPKKVVLVHDAILRRGELEKLVQTRAVSKLWDETPPRTRTEKATV